MANPMTAKLAAMEPATEAQICDIALAKLKAEGWKCACEVQSIDIVAQRDGLLMACEAKRTFNDTLKRQLNRAAYQSQRTLGIIGSIPSWDALQWLEGRNMGLWVVRDGKVNEVLQCGPQYPAPYNIDRVKRYADAHHAAWPDARAGIPGGGFAPAQDVQRRVDIYRAANPHASWREIFAAVPSHYLTHSAMCSALRSNAKFLEIKARRKS